MPKRATVYRKKDNARERLVPRGASPEVCVEAGEAVIDLTTWADQLVQSMLRRTVHISQQDQFDRFSDNSIQVIPEAS
jgi:hypothetical protein